MPRSTHDHFWWRQGGVFALLFVLVAGGAAWLSSTSASSEPPARSAVTPALHRVVDPFFRSAYLYGGTPLTPAQEGRRYGIMILRQTDAAVVPRLKAGNPKLRVFMIVDMMSADPGDPTGISNWVGYTEADTNHPEWFLTDAGGNRLPFKDYPDSLVMDVGNPAYQRAGLANITRLAKAGGFDGVFLDDANASLRWILAGGSAECVKYPTDAKWQPAVYSFLSSVAPQLRAAGLLVAANIGGSTITPGLWQRWNGPLDGAMEESFTNGGSGRDSNGLWLARLKHALWSEANGKIALDHAVTATRSGARYGLATMLLAANGENKFYASTDYSHEVWWPEYTATKRLGSALGRFSVLPNGVYQRRFTNGVVLVNPQMHAASRVPLGGAYVGSGLGRVRSVRLTRTSGVVLLKA
jgi:hypothetical protein